MSRPPNVPPALAGRFFRGEWAVRQRLLTRDALRGSAWRRLFHGVYVDASVPVTHRLLCAAAHAYVLPAGSVLAGGSAAHLHGVPAAEHDPVEAIVPAGRRPRTVAGLRPHVGTLAPDEVHLISGLRVTSPPRTCWDLVRWRGLVHGLVMTESLVATGRLFRGELEAYATRRRADQGGRRFADAVALFEEGAQSPPETELRVRLMLAGLPRPVVQHEVRVGGRFVARVDLAWPACRVAVEYDGAWHGAPGQLHADRHRLNRLAGAGWVVLHVTSVRLRIDFDAVVAEIGAALASPGPAATRSGLFPAV